jgi:hypothetical protein
MAKLCASRWIEWVECSDPGLCESEIADSQGALSSEPHVSRNAVEVSRRGCLVRVGTRSRRFVRYFGSSHLRVAFCFS